MVVLESSENKSNTNEGGDNPQMLIEGISNELFGKQRRKCENKKENKRRFHSIVEIHRDKECDNNSYHKPLN